MRKNKTKHSIKRQFAFVSIGLLAGTILLCWFINDTFLPKYYESTREEALVDAYQMITEALADNGISEEFIVSLWQVASKSNASGIIIDANAVPLVTFGDEGEYLEEQLKANLYGRNFSVKKIIDITPEYVLQKTEDRRLRMEYMELFGMSGSGISMLFRIPLANIRESADIANRFLIYVGIIAVSLSSIIMWLVARKITEPILELTDISEKMIHLDFEAKYHGQTRNEIALLGENINKLSGSLEKTISELKTANNELKNDIENKQQIDEMRKEFLSNISHELKTPIALIQGYAEGLKEDINEDAESRSYYCEVIIDEAAKMNLMVKKLMTLNQLESGNDNVAMERFDIVTLTCNYIQSAQILTKQEGITVKMEHYDPIYVWADEFKTEEVLMNYFSNAVNHVSGNGKIIDVKLEQRDKTVRVSVFNTGTPIPEESIDHLWEKFYKVDKARTREYGGSGVGLSIVKAIMESMNQKYGVRNYINGVEFWFELEMVN